MEKGKEFYNWLQQFIKESGHQFGRGFFVELHNGEFLYRGTDKYNEWYNNKLEEYKQIK